MSAKSDADKKIEKNVTNIYGNKKQKFNFIISHEFHKRTFFFLFTMLKRLVFK